MNIENIKYCLEALASYDPKDIDDDVIDVRFESEDQGDTGADVSIVDLASKSLSLVTKLEAQLKISTDKLSDIASFRNPDPETMAQDALCEIEEIN